MSLSHSAASSAAGGRGGLSPDYISTLRLRNGVQIAALIPRLGLAGGRPLSLMPNAGRPPLRSARADAPTRRERWEKWI